MGPSYRQANSHRHQDMDVACVVEAHQAGTQDRA